MFVLKVYRAKRFSPNSEDKDRAILDAVAARLEDSGYAISSVNEEQLTADIKADIILTMARSQEALAVLKAKEAEGCLVVNTAEGVEACRRSNIDRLMRANGLPAAPPEGNDGYWIKRGDEAAQSKGDVVFAADETHKDEAVRRMKARGVTDIVVTAHVNGDLVKFYGVARTGFFRMFYPNEEGHSKFGDEARNGRPHHYRFDTEALKAAAEQLAGLAKVDVYGGDCIVRDNGTFAIIDFNDWPSFSKCREEAAEAIAKKAAPPTSPVGRL